MWGKKKPVEEPVEVDEVFDDLYAELDDIVVAAKQPEAEVPVDFEARVAELEALLREAQEGARLARLAAKPEGLSPFKTPFAAKPVSKVERPRELHRHITPVEVEAGESRIVSQFEGNEPEDKKVYPAVWNLGYRLEELAAAVASILVDEDTGEIKHEHPGYAADDHTHPPQDLTHNHDDQYFAKGGASDVDGNPLPLPYGDAYTLGTALDEHDHDHTHDHDDEYASKGELSEVKGDIERLELELELLAKTLESGEWEVAATAAVRPGEMHMAITELSSQQNVLTINSEDLAGKTHGWATLHEGDYVELLEVEESNRNISHDYGLFVVTQFEISDTIATITLDLHQGQGDAVTGEKFEVRLLDIADAELDMASMDARYLRSGAGSHEVTQNWKIVGNGKTYLNISGDKTHIYHLDTPGDRAHAANKGYVDDELAKKADTHTHPYASSSHSHDYATSNHSHSVIFRSGTSTNPSLSKGEPFLNTSYKVIYIGT